MKKAYLYIFIFLLWVMISSVTAQQDAIQRIIDKAIETANAAIPTLGRPISWQWFQLSPVSDTSLGCPLVSGVALPAPVTPYKVTLKYADGLEYIVHVSADTTLAQLCDSKFVAVPTPTPNGLTPTVIVTPTASNFISPCTLSPLGAFANVRSQPSVDATQVSIIYENNAYAVIGRNADTSWYLINEGWVSATVVQLSPNCGAIPVSEGIVPSLGATPALPSRLCPFGFAGYLMPRLRIGPVTAQVAVGGVPNRLRNEPSLTGGIIGEIQPGRRLDAVLQGPVCRDGLVWWQVNIDGNIGWTAESEATQTDYYLVPLPPEPSSLPREGILLAGHAGPITSISFHPNGSQLVTADAVDTFLRLWDTRTGAPIQSVIRSNTPIITARYVNDNTVLIGLADGTAQLWQTSPTLTIPNVFQAIIENYYVISNNGGLAVSGCRELMTDLGCRGGQVTIWRLSDGALGRVIETGTSTITAIDYSPDGLQLLIGDVFGTVALLNLSETTPRTTTLPNLIQGLTFFPPDPTRFIVAACMDSGPLIADCAMTSISTYESANLNRVAQFIIAGDVMQMAISPDGRLLAIGFSNGEIRLYNFADGVERRVISVHTGAITALAFSPDGRYLASGSADATARLWEIITPVD